MNKTEEIMKKVQKMNWDDTTGKAMIVGIIAMAVCGLGPIGMILGGAGGVYLSQYLDRKPIHKGGKPQENE